MTVPLPQVSIDERAALVLLTRAMFDQIDEIAEIRRSGGAAKISISLLHEMASVLNEVPSHILQCYLDMLPTISSSTQGHRRVSADDETAEMFSKPRKRFINKIRADFKLEPRVA